MSFAGIECDLIDNADGQRLRTVSLPLVPHVGEELELDAGGEHAGNGLYSIISVRYHIRTRRIVRNDHLFGVSLYLERLA